MTDTQQSVVGANVLVYSYHYFPGEEFEVITEIDDAEEFLGGREDGGISVVSQPDDFEGFAIEYDFSAVPFYGILYISKDENLREGQSGLQLRGTANYISSEENLLQTRVDEFEAS